MSDLEATTRVEVVLRGRVATIEDLRAALDVLTAEGIPETFEVDVAQGHERIPEEGVPYAQQRQEPYLRLSAERAGKRGAA